MVAHHRRRLQSPLWFHRLPHFRRTHPGGDIQQPAQSGFQDLPERRVGRQGASLLPASLLRYRTDSRTGVLPGETEDALRKVFRPRRQHARVGAGHAHLYHSGHPVTSAHHATLRPPNGFRW